MLHGNTRLVPHPIVCTKRQIPKGNPKRERKSKSDWPSSKNTVPSKESVQSRSESQSTLEAPQGGHDEVEDSARLAQPKQSETANEDGGSRGEAGGVDVSHDHADSGRRQSKEGGNELEAASTSRDTTLVAAPNFPALLPKGQKRGRGGATYKLVHSGTFDMADHTEDRVRPAAAALPKKLVVTVTLPPNAVRDPEEAFFYESYWMFEFFGVLFGVGERRAR